ncbi:MAG TPA: HAD-IA family hydrolase [Blastocatellia bacterium]|nr:HAD-IA family hydrolase [Blastocatellia bacterium]HMV85556.1 HAD-IA family hydrolase [Blastocatellia bacterium]HMX25856.1 HAD-IA family hydrolase [Blastocatellia bacterium]HMZ18493.1 HAD-IA family hydrolase [Blastocatellia bacterium]HNG30534.1 HAD-IA family hydrolase [Blastocatellia bacterium]
MPGQIFQAVIFDLYTALLDSWSLWNETAGTEESGRQWRKKYLELTYQAGRYRRYETIIAESAQAVGLAEEQAMMLIENWGALQPWPEARQILSEISSRIPIAVATNSSLALAEIAVACVGVPFAAVATAEEAGYYKPQPQPYRLALERLGCAAENVLFVAGSASDVPGATNVGMTVYWHNRANLKLADQATHPQFIAESLQPLTELL